MTIYYAINQGSGDVLMYQALERKAAMIQQILTNKGTDRTVEAIDSDDLVFGDLKALATGDPRVLELLRAKRTLGELEGAKRTHDRSLVRARRTG